MGKAEAWKAPVDQNDQSGFLFACTKHHSKYDLMWTRIFLSAMALMFLAFGLWSLFDPTGMTSQLGVSVSGPNGTFEMRGMFGGVSLGASALSAAGVVRTSMVRPALWFIVAYMGGYCLARLVSVGLGDLPEPATWRFVAFEAVSLIFASLALRNQT